LKLSYLNRHFCNAAIISRIYINHRNDLQMKIHREGMMPLLHWALGYFLGCLNTRLMGIYYKPAKQRIILITSSYSLVTF